MNWGKMCQQVKVLLNVCMKGEGDVSLLTRGSSIRILNAFKICSLTFFPGFFSIAEKSGRIRVAKSLLRNSGVYTFIVQARDQDGNGPYTHTAHVQITVLEATNSPPRWIIPPDQNMTVSVLEVITNPCTSLVSSCRANHYLNWSYH